MRVEGSGYEMYGVTHVRHVKLRNLRVGGGGENEGADTFALIHR